MSKERYQVGRSPYIIVSECKGDLVVRPWMDLDVKAKGDFTVEEETEQLSFTAVGDLVLHVPEGTSIHLETGWGDVSIRSITGELSLNSVLGDLILSNVATAKVGHVAGDLVAKNLSGSLTVQKVDGDVVARNVDGDMALELVNSDLTAQYVNGAVSLDEILGDINIRSVSGDFQIVKGSRDANIRNLGGLCLVKNISGDVRLLGGLGPYDHTLSCGGDAVVTWPVEAPLLLEAEASSIDNRLPLVDVKQSEGKLSGRIGDGKTRLTIEAGGRLVLKEAQIVSKKWHEGGEPVFDFDFVSELAGLGAKISSEVNEQVTRVTAELENNFGPDFMQRMTEQFSQKAAAAAQKAQQAAEREYARPKSTPKEPPKSEKRAGSTSSQEESDANYEAKLKILKMVEKGVISPDEASLLLEALQGD